MQVTLAALVNITVDDTDPRMFYTPPGSWHSSSVVCSVCLNPDTRDAFQNTYHSGIHVPLPPSPPSPSSSSLSSFPSSRPSPPSPPVEVDDDDDDRGGGGSGSGSGSSSGNGGRVDNDENKLKTVANRQEEPKPTTVPGAHRRRSDSEDPNAVSAHFNFTG